jgi:hemerythrin
MVKESMLDVVNDIENTEIVSWSDKYATGIELIDSQHHQLVNLTNELYRACLSGGEERLAVFKEAMSRMVDYVRFHFTAELKLLEAVKYPDYNNHKKMHNDLVEEILTASNTYDDGRKFVPNKFVRTLKDWVFGHIAVYDKLYAAFVAEQKTKGVLTDQSIREIGLSVNKS